MTSWRKDKRFLCPDCKQPIRIAIASANSLTDSPDVIAYCTRCNRFFDKKEWRAEPWKNDSLSDVPF